MVQHKQVQLVMASLWTFFNSLAAKKTKVIAFPSVCVIKCPTQFRDTLFKLWVIKVFLWLFLSCVFGVFFGVWFFFLVTCPCKKFYRSLE